MHEALRWLLPLGLLVSALAAIGWGARVVLARASTSAPTRPRGRAHAREHAATHHAIWLPVAQELGLAMHAGVEGAATRLRMSGSRRGVAITLDVHIPWAVAATIWQALREGQGGTAGTAGDLRLTLSVPLTAPMPPGLDIRRRTAGAPGWAHGEPSLGDPALDAALQIQGGDRAATQALLTDTRVLAALARVARLGLPFACTEGAVTLTAHPLRIASFRPGQAKEHADASAGLAAALHERQAAPWRALAARLGLTHGGSGLSGAISGVAVGIDAGFDAGIAVVDVGAALRPLHIAGRDPGGPGDPIRFPPPGLSGALAGRTRDKFLARRVLADATTAGALLAVIGGTPGAALVDGTLRLPIRPGPDAVSTLEAAVALSRRLVRAAR